MRIANVQFITVEIRDSLRIPNRLEGLWLPFKMLCKEIAQEAGRNLCPFTIPSYANMIQFLQV